MARSRRSLAIILLRSPVAPSRDGPSQASVVDQFFARHPYVPSASRKLSTRGWLIVAISLLLLVSCEHSAVADPQLQRIQAKAERAKQGVIEWARSGQDPSHMVRLMEQVEPSLRAGKFTKAETLLDTVLQMLSEHDAGHIGSDEPITDEFGDPKRVEIIGYGGDAMEPAS